MTDSRPVFSIEYDSTSYIFVLCVVNELICINYCIIAKGRSFQNVGIFAVKGDQS